MTKLLIISSCKAYYYIISHTPRLTQGSAVMRFSSKCKLITSVKAQKKLLLKIALNSFYSLRQKENSILNHSSNSELALHCHKKAVFQGLAVYKHKQTTPRHSLYSTPIECDCSFHDSTTCFACYTPGRREGKSAERCSSAFARSACIHLHLMQTVLRNANRSVWK